MATEGKGSDVQVPEASLTVVNTEVDNSSTDTSDSSVPAPPLHVTIPVTHRAREEVERMHDPPPSPLSALHIQDLTSRPEPPPKSPMKKCGNCDLFQQCWGLGDSHTIWEFKRLGERKFGEAASKR